MIGSFSVNGERGMPGWGTALCESLGMRAAVCVSTVVLFKDLGLA